MKKVNYGFKRGVVDGSVYLSSIPHVGETVSLIDDKSGWEYKVLAVVHFAYASLSPTDQGYLPAAWVHLEKDDSTRTPRR